MPIITWKTSKKDSSLNREFGTLLIFREMSGGDSFREYDLFINDKLIGEVLKGDSYYIKLTPGKYNIHLKIAAISTPSITVTINLNEISYLVTGTQLKQYLFFNNLAALKSKNRIYVKELTSTLDTTIPLVDIPKETKMDVLKKLDTCITDEILCKFSYAPRESLYKNNRRRIICSFVGIAILFIVYNSITAILSNTFSLHVFLKTILLQGGFYLVIGAFGLAIYKSYCSDFKH